MITTERLQLADALRELGEMYPEMRYGQLVEAVAVWASDAQPLGVGEVTDAQLLAAARAHIQRRRGGLKSSAAS
jgi:hypothetical protein